MTASRKDGWIMLESSMTLPDRVFMMLGSIMVLRLPVHIMACCISLLKKARSLDEKELSSAT